MATLLFGKQHRELLARLAERWWPEGPVVAAIEGFPGVGKSLVAESLVEQVARQSPAALAVTTQCPESVTGLVDDLLISLALELEGQGETTLTDALDAGRLDTRALEHLLTKEILIVIEEFQHSLDSSGRPVAGLSAVLERLAHRPSLRGRVLLVSSRSVERARWSERFATTWLRSLKSDDGEGLLEEMLNEAGRLEDVPQHRRHDVVNWLGGNPRAMRLLVAALRNDSLDDLIGLAPEVWEARDREVEPSLLRKFEEEVLRRAEHRLDDSTRLFLQRLSAFRRPIRSDAFEFLAEPASDFRQMRDELIARFMIEQRGGRYVMHPVLRDTVHFHLPPTDRRRAHTAAGAYYARPFRARRVAGRSEKVSADFIEARYHLTLAEREEDLREIAQRFERHLLATIGFTSRLPTDPTERDERIALLSALLQARGAKGLEYHLARLLLARNRPGDTDRALPHARRATGPRSPAAAWVLRIRLENQVYGADEAVRAARDGIARVPPEQNLFALYQSAGEMLAAAGRTEDALALLKEGIARVPPEQSLFVLFQTAGRILSIAGRIEEAYEWLWQGIIKVSGFDFNGYRLVEQVLYCSAAARHSDWIRRIIDSEEVLSIQSQQKALACILERQLAGAWEQAAEAGEQAAFEYPTYIAVRAQAAFSWLCAGHADRASRLLHDSSTTMPHGKASSVTWLAALVDLARGNIETSTRWFESYLGRSIQNGERCDLATLLQLWDQNAGGSEGQNLAYHFPTLPPSVTGLAISVTRRQDGPRVLPENLAESIDVKGTAEPRATSFDATWRPARILEAMRPEGWSGLYVVGCFDRMKTVYVQQSRALTLVHALLTGDDLQAGQRVGVIGGGAAGVTVAAAAAVKGCNVVLYEAADTLLPLQTGNHKRFLHPHLYDWPARHSTVPQAGLPLLDWHADLARDVAKQIQDEFQALCRETVESINVRTRTRIQKLEQLGGGGDGFRVRVIGNHGDTVDEFHVVVIAIGFGVEQREHFSVMTPAYWEDDSLDQSIRFGARPRRILVSGAGDGALIDILRASLQNFRHEDLLERLPSPEVLEPLCERFMDVEHRTRTAQSNNPHQPADLNRLYNDIEIPEGVLEAIRRQARSDTEVYFNYPRPETFSIHSAVLNRFLVHLMLRAGIVKRRLGRITDIQRPSTTQAMYLVEIDNIRPAEGDDYDLVVLRHGPPKTFFNDSFPFLAEACASLGGKVADLDLTSTLDPATRAFFSVGSGA